jgi:hypothetical protein
MAHLHGVRGNILLTTKLSGDMPTSYHRLWQEEEARYVFLNKIEKICKSMKY